MDADIAPELQSRVVEAAEAKRTLRIRGYGSKEFYGRTVVADAILEVAGHCGILGYDPSELVITARAGTPLKEVEAVLRESGQMLPFEPPHFADRATIGGAVAAGLSGPGRPWRGAVRDVLLGVRLLDGKGQILKFGGQVMKNVAGYDLSRLMAGSLGTLGVILEVSLRLTPIPVEERTLLLERDDTGFRGLMRKLRATPVPLTGASYADGQARLRLSGHPSVLEGVRADHGGSWAHEDDRYWLDLRDQRLGFFQHTEDLWRISVPPDSSPLSISGDHVVDWGGAQHWVRSSTEETTARELATSAGGHALLFRSSRDDQIADRFQPLADPLASLHQRLKAVFDPQRILNPGRMYADL